jgi:flavin-dependent dehydrogenase
MAAMFAHFEGGQRDPGIDEGATLILHTEEQNSWFWYIPLPDNRVSVGTVGPIDYLIKGRQGNPEATFEEEIQRCPGLLPRLQEATRCSPVHVLNDFSYVSERVAGDGWMLVGDACGFLDPMYSSGVLLALRSGELAADTLLAALADDDLSGDRLSAYGERFNNGMNAFRRLVYAFYTKGFSFGRFLAKHPQHRMPVILILQGDVIDQDFTALFADLRVWLDDMSADTSDDPAAANSTATDAAATRNPPGESLPSAAVSP